MKLLAIIASLVFLPALGMNDQPRTNPATAATQSTHAPADTKTSSALREQARKALRAGNTTKARRFMELARAGFLPIAERSAWWLIESEIEFATGQFAASGLSAMRIVIVYPKAPEVGEAYFIAARAYEKLERPTKAVELYEECAKHPKTPKSIQSLASQRFKALKDAR